MRTARMPMIKELFDTGVPAPKGVYGIEVEIEFEDKGSGLPEGVYVPDGWVSHSEHSLRNGIEYVFDKPAGPLGMSKRVGRLYDHLDKLPVVWDSIRTSVHTHINMSNETLLDTYKFITAYTLLEEVILNYCDQRRRGNLFCLNVKEGESLAHQLKSDIANYKCLSFAANHVNSIRYAGMNLAALHRFNSLEFRSLHGGANRSEVIQWSKMLKHLLVHSKRYRSPQTIIDKYFVTDPLVFMRSLLPPAFVRKITGKNTAWIDQLEGSLGLVSNFAYAADWDIWTKRVSGKKVKLTPPPSSFLNSPHISLSEADMPSTSLGQTTTTWATSANPTPPGVQVITDD